MIRAYTRVHPPVTRVLSPLLRSPAVGKVGKPRRGHSLVEFVILVWKVRLVTNRRLEPSCMLVHSHGTLKVRPRVVRTVKPLFRLPRGSTLRSLRERVEFLELACLCSGLGTVYCRAP